MNAVALDIWQDLREKRLWPVAAALLVALVAVPFVMVDSEEVPSEAGTPAAAPKRLEPLGGKALVAASDHSIQDGSALRAFLRKNPFQPIERLAANPAGLAAGASESAPPTGGTSGPTTISSAGGGASSGPTGGSGFTPGPMGSPEPPTGGGGGDGNDGGNSETRSVVKQYTYTANLHFGVTGRETFYRELTQLSPLPNDEATMLMFLGVTADGKRAVFLVDNGLQAFGEGRCKPSASKCTFLYMASGKDRDEERFRDAAGTEFTLRLDRLSRVDLESLQKSEKRDESPNAEAGSAMGLTGFGFPLLARQEETALVPVPSLAHP